MAIYEIFGLKPDILTDTKIIFDQGTTVVWHSNVTYDNTIIEIPEQLVCDLTKVGPNGRDAGPMSNGIWYAYIIYNPTTQKYATLASHSYIYDNVVFPNGFPWWKWLCIGLPMASSRLVPVHITAWPVPVVTLTEPVWVARLSVAPTWQMMDLAPYMPHNARMGLFRTIMSGSTGNSSFTIAPLAGGYGARLANYVSNGVTSVKSRVESDMRVFGLVSGGTSTLVDVYLDGWEMTDQA
jgi:hypothetical protein